jgi:hypothetical protein
MVIVVVESIVVVVASSVAFTLDEDVVGISGQPWTELATAEASSKFKHK